MGYAKMHKDIRAAKLAREEKEQRAILNGQILAGQRGNHTCAMCGLPPSPDDLFMERWNVIVHTSCAFEGECDFDVTATVKPSGSIEFTYTP